MIELLYSDAELVVCIKPAGLLSQSDGSGEPDLLQALQAQLGGPVWPVHRLDKPVGGVMAAARSRAAAAALSGEAAQHAMKKEYLAVVCGQPQPARGELHDWLFHDARQNKTFVVERQRRGVRDALLQYRTLQTVPGSGGALTLVRIRLQTGRTHQIRAQFAGHGWPLLGDSRYGGGRGTPALWAAGLQLEHPKTGQTLCFSALPQGPVWEQFDAACDMNGKDRADE